MNDGQENLGAGLGFKAAVNAINRVAAAFPA
jgi:hypothetical protein